MEFNSVYLICAVISVVVSAAVQCFFKKKNDKYTAKLDKENYITKTQFDYEFRMYQNLSLAAFDCVAKSEILFPTGLVIAQQPTKEIYLNRYREAANKLNEFTNQLYKSQSFMDENLFRSYLKLRDICDLQVTGYYLIYVSEPNSNIDDMEYLEGTKEMREQFNKCSESLSVYLKSLRVMN